MGIRDAAHNRVQKLGKQRDKYTCQICGGKDQVEGHHIINFKFGGAADVDNIITLCHRCHMQVHRGNIDILKF